MNAASTTKLAQALSAHTFDGRYSLGTAAIVEALHEEFRLPYDQIAGIAGVSLAGLRRWRERDMGDRANFEPLLNYAERLASGVSLDVAPAEGGPASVPVMPLTIADAKRGLAAMFGVDPAMIEIVIKG